MRAGIFRSVVLFAGLAGAVSSAQAQDFELPAGDATPEDVEAQTKAPEPKPEVAPAPPRPPKPAATGGRRAPPPRVESGAQPDADDDRVLVVIRAEGAPMVAFAAALAPEATAALARRLEARAQSLTLALNPNAETDARREIDEAAQEVELGIEAFEQLDLARADVVLRDAVEALVGHLGALTPKDRTQLARGLFALAVTVLFDGSTDASDELLAALAALEPGFTPEPDRYPSNVLHRFERLRGGLSDHRETGALWVDSVPAGAEVLVDGGARGYAPLRVDGLPVGQHAVTLRHPGFAAVGRLMRVAPPGLTGLELKMPSGPGTRTWQRLTKEAIHDPTAGPEAARGLDAGRVALVWLSGTPDAPVAEGVWIDRRRNAVLGRFSGRPLDARIDVAATRLALGITRADAQLEVVSAPAPEAAPMWQGEVTEQWWFWALVGSAAVAAVATTGWALARGGDQGPPNNTAIFRF